MIAGSSAIMIGGIVYVVAMLAIGLLASRNVADAADFVVAGRRLPTWLCTFTLFATFFGGGTCIGAAGAAYSGGLLAVIAYAPNAKPSAARTWATTTFRSSRRRSWSSRKPCGSTRRW